MAKLTAKARNALPSSTFAGPDRSYPIPDKAHAVAAKARATQFAPPAVKARVDAKANAVIAGGKMPMAGPSERGHITHNPDNNLPMHAQHARGRKRGMGY